MRSWVIASVVCAAASASAVGVAQPDARREAGQHFQRGQAAQAAGRYREAITEYAAAYALVPHPNSLYNLAVCYERLDDAAHAVEYYERYLAASPDASDAAAVRDKLRALRAKLPASTGPDDGGDAGTDAGADGTGLSPAPPMPVAPPEDASMQPPAPAGSWGAPAAGGIGALGPPVVRPPGRGWHVGASYGLGFGDVPVQRYLLRAGMRPFERLDADVELGGFGKNDHAIGVAARWRIARRGVTLPFVHAAATIGLARQDASPGADLRFPIGFELGGGVQLGAPGKGNLELCAAVRWVRNGWDAASTGADSYVNDAIALAVDLGFGFDVPIRIAPR